MRKLFLIIVMFFTLLSANSSEYTDFVTDLYSKENNQNVKIVSKKEYVQEYAQIIGNYCISGIAYGNGYMKVPHRKKLRITYICLLDKECKPVWGCVIPR